jgi:Peptidase family S41
MVFPQPSKLIDGHGLGSVRTMPEFRAFVDQQPGLTGEQRSVLVDQARVLVEELYVHLPLKRAMHAVDPVQRQRLLRRRMGTLDDRAFHAELLDIFISVRDLHTNYLLPVPFGGRVAFLGVLVERFTNGNQTKWVISKVSRLLETEPSLRPGAVVTHWNGAPIEQAVWRNAQREAGSNLAARMARGLESLTMRYLVISLPPDEDWVDLRYEIDGQAHEARLMWFVARSSADVFGGDGQASGLLADLTTPTSRLVGVDLRTELSRRTKKLLFAPEALREEQRVAQADGLPAPTDRQLADNVIVTSRPDDLTAKLVDTAHGRFGYLRLWTFHMKDGNIVAFLNEVIRLLEDEFPPQGLIIDVRGNGGGFIIAAEFLLQLLTPKRITAEPAQFVNTPATLRLCGAVADMNPWRDSIAQATETGAQFSAGVALSPEHLVNLVGQVYHGPVVLITDALCYSACDMFAAGFVDHGIGEVIGVDANTGAGGANVLDHGTLREIWPDGPLAELPAGAQMRVSLRRTLRVGANAGQPVEDLGVVPHVLQEVTLDDLLHENRDLLDAAAKILAGRPPRVLKAQIVPSQGDTVKLRLTATGASSLDVYVDGRPQVVGAAPGAEVPLRVSQTSVVRVEAFADGALVGARQLTFDS